jgi:poly(beta-D-mannuronate) lyase
MVRLIKSFWAYAWIAVALATPCSAGDMLHSPWDTPVKPTETGYVCPEAPRLAHNLDLDGYYIDSHYSIVDEAKKKAYEERSEPFTRLSQLVVHAADAYRTTGSQSAAECVITLLDAAAKDKALTGRMMTSQATYVQDWSLSAWAIGYLKVRSSGSGSVQQTAEITSWLKNLALKNRDYYESKAMDPYSDAHNNLLYWAGLAISAAGIAANDHKLFNWGMNAYKQGVRDITADGTLPLEMNRAGKALHYHLYALGPLIMLAELGESNGLDMYAKRNYAIKRLVKRCVAGLLDPSYFVQHTGVPQDMQRGIGAEEIGWAKPYLRRFPDAKILALLAKAESLSYTTWGGLPPD